MTFQITCGRTGQEVFLLRLWKRMITSFRAIVLSKEVVQTLLAQGKEKGEAGCRAAAGRCCRQAECSPAGTRTITLTGGITAQYWGGRVRASFCKNHDSGGLVDRG